MPDKVTYQTIDAQSVGQRLDNFLIKFLKGVPKSHIYRIIRSGEVRINKGRAKPSTKLNLEDVIRIPPIRVSEQIIKQSPDNLRERVLDNLIFENPYFMAMNKPAGLAVHGGSGLSWGVIEILRQCFPKHTELELIHRLDRDTSGCLLIAKRRSWLRKLQAAWAEDVDKYYIARLEGLCADAQWTVNQPLLKNTLKSGERIVIIDPLGKQSKTHFEVLERDTSSTLVRIKLQTGRTHQIRVHAQYSGHSVLGDKKYGKIAAKRLYLHASECVLNLEDYEVPLVIKAPVPDEFYRE